LTTPLTLAGDERILVTGASGWLGRSLLSKLLPVVERGNLMTVASRDRDLLVDGHRVEIRTWTDEDAEQFAPTHVVHLAYLTRDRMASLGADRYAAENTALTARVMKMLAWPSVRALVHTSSGAALAVAPEPYGLLKRDEERLFQDACSQRGITCVTCRVWSVSGPHVLEPGKYAFSDLIRQAQSGGDVVVRSSHRVYRRYVDAGELMDLALRLALADRSAVFDSGGEYVEVGELATLILDEIGTPKQRVRRGIVAGPDDEYAADDSAFLELAAQMGVELSSLRAQIRQTAQRLGSASVEA
jgi:nucleoside-diphosphate-sugar epimerase